MALSGIQIFQKLPKSNCKECKFPTCLAFAMKLAAKQTEIGNCPYISEEVKTLLEESSAPPVRKITIGSGDNAVVLGEETVLFRHEKTFAHPCGFALNLSDKCDDAAVDAAVAAINDSVVERVGQMLRVDMIQVVNDSGDADRFTAVASRVAASVKAAIVLKSGSAAALAAAAKALNGKNPLLFGTCDHNEVAPIAKAEGCPMVVSGSTLDELSLATTALGKAGIKDMILNPSTSSLGDLLRTLTLLRRAAISKSHKPLGFPVITFPGEGEDSLQEASFAGVAIAKYAGIVVLASIEKEKMAALFTMRQNIYTDPQKPMCVEQKVYKIGDPDENSPVIITTNFSLTYFIVSGEIENSQVSAWLMIMDCEGLSVLTAWAAGKFTADTIVKYVKESSGIEDLVKTRELMIPGYAAVLSGGIEAKLDGWKVVVGPREANALPAFLKKHVAA